MTERGRGGGGGGGGGGGRGGGGGEYKVQYQFFPIERYVCCNGGVVETCGCVC